MFLITCLRCCSGQLVQQQNTIFQKVGAISSTQAKWRVTFIDDLSVFDNECGRVMSQLHKVNVLYKRMLSSLHIENSKELNKPRIVPAMGKYEGLMRFPSFLEVKHSIRMIQNRLHDLMYEYSGYKNLGHRHKRSFLPFIGQISSFLFGTVSDSDLDTIRRQINVIKKSQETVTHVLRESLTILNISRTRIIDNRRAIKDIADMVVKDFKKVDMLVELILIIYDVDRNIDSLIQYFSHLKQQVNMLALGRLGPSVVSPGDLRECLIRLKLTIPPGLKLVKDPVADLWFYYEHIHCVTLVDTNRILMVTRFCHGHV